MSEVVVGRFSKTGDYPFHERTNPFLWDALFRIRMATASPEQIAVELNEKEADKDDLILIEQALKELAERFPS